MDSDFSDHEFCETNFCEPSPVKIRSSLLVIDQKKRKETLEKFQSIRQQVEKTDRECSLNIGQKLQGTPAINENIINEPKHDDKIKFHPRGRNFFIDFEDDLSPFLWFPENSIFFNRTKEQFMNCLEQGLVPNYKWDSEMGRVLTSYCLTAFSAEQDELTAYLILHFLSKSHIPYDLICLRKRGSPYFGRFLEVLRISVKSYTADEALNLFKEAISASLDSRGFSVNVFQSFLSSCLEISLKKYSADDIADWIIERNLLPEEVSYLLGILPRSGLSRDFALLFASKALAFIACSTEISSEKSFQLSSIETFFKNHESEMIDLPLNTLFHLLNTLNYIIIQLPSCDPVPLKGILNSLESLKNLYIRQEKCLNTFFINELIYRICSAIRTRIPLDSSIELEVSQI